MVITFKKVIVSSMIFLYKCEPTLDMRLFTCNWQPAIMKITRLLYC